MKRILISILLLGLLSLAGCGGGSGTPLPPPTKTAKIVFLASSSASYPINNYVIANFVIPGKLAIPVTAGTNGIATGYITGSGPTVSGSFFADFYPAHDGKAENLTVMASPGNDLGLGVFLSLTCTYSDQTLTKSAIKTLLDTLNPGPLSVTRGLVDPATPGITIYQSVFYNYSVSVQ
jgi:predicted small lipoprotein YifL